MPLELLYAWLMLFLKTFGLIILFPALVCRQLPVMRSEASRLAVTGFVLHAGAARVGPGWALDGLCWR